MSYDEQPDGDPHGECAAAIADLRAKLAKAEATSEGRRRALDEKAAEVRAEWARAEKAEAENAARLKRIDDIETAFDDYNDTLSARSQPDTMRGGDEIRESREALRAAIDNARKPVI